MKQINVVSLFFALVLLQVSACLKANQPQITAPTIEPDTATREGLYFAETGHTVKPPFLDFYLNHQNKWLLGYPITEALDHEGWQVQYFQYTRLEVHPENKPDYFITVGWLGQLSHRTKPPIKHRAAPIYYPETGHTISGDFLSFFEAHGNTVQFGRPISEPFIEQGLVMQDFQSARLIWQPHLPVATRVQLEPIGETYFLSSGLPLSLLDPIPKPPNTVNFTRSIQPPPEEATASLTLEGTPTPDILRVTASLQHQKGPVAERSLRLYWGNEGHQSRLLPPTNPAGQTHMLINVLGVQALAFRLTTPSGQHTFATHKFP